ncbi:dual specificity protein phosphatase 19 [Zeugodacus cucurbitae]|uniref:dual specificity protein phosphatase 19 n=1 Tax=Zeugodacus cucurbitae TaxID=28588 RepID=UPI0023D90DD8|nr:dual specificity protein phosphatase 19 [Zeugodacus cucurbitae]
MSLLQQLQTKRKALKATTTTVTTESGKRFIVANATTSTPIQQQLQAQSYGFVVDTKPDTTPACILADFLYLGSQDAVNSENISAYKLTHILSVGIETPLLDSDKVVRHFLPCLDLPETLLSAHVIPAANKFIKSAELARGRVLVHCNAGVSRAASIVIAYLILVRGMRYDAAYTLVKSKRECIQPNVGFIKQLKQLKLNDV